MTAIRRPVCEKTLAARRCRCGGLCNAAGTYTCIVECDIVGLNKVTGDAASTHLRINIIHLFIVLNVSNIIKTTQLCLRIDYPLIDY